MIILLIIRDYDYDADADWFKWDRNLMDPPKHIRCVGRNRQNSKDCTY